MEFLGSLWRGDAGLAKTYWIYGAIGSLIFFAIPGALQAGLWVSGSENAALGAFSLFYSFGFAPAYVVFISVAIWRSAARYQGNPLWAKLAKLAVVLGILEFVLVIADFT